MVQFKLLASNHVHHVVDSDGISISFWDYSSLFAPESDSSQFIGFKEHQAILGEDGSSEEFFLMFSKN